MLMLFIVLCCVVTTFCTEFPSNISVDFSKSIWNIQTKFHHKSKKNQKTKTKKSHTNTNKQIKKNKKKKTKLLVPKSQWVWNILGMMLWIMSGTFNSYRFSVTATLSINAQGSVWGGCPQKFKQNENVILIGAICWAIFG